MAERCPYHHPLPWKLVGALLQHHVDDGAAVVAELGREAVVLNLELLHDLDRGW